MPILDILQEVGWIRVKDGTEEKTIAVWTFQITLVSIKMYQQEVENTMGGRFIQISNPEKLKLSIPDLEIIDDTVLERSRPHYNIAPTQDILTVLNTTPPKLVFTHWGLVPFWAKDKTIGYKMINARAETLTTKPSFREPLKKHRCIVFTDGFYEWKSIDKSKTPYFIHMKTESLLPLPACGIIGLIRRLGRPSTQVPL